MPKNYTSKKYWDSQYENIQFSQANYRSAVYRLLKKYFYGRQFGKAKPSCFEIGCFPGSFLSVFAKFGFTVSGIDVADGADSALVNWLKSKDYSVGKITKGDFFSFEPKKKYDVVCSFGFIEHFGNFEEVVLQHIPLVKENGYVVITTPNFKGKIQNYLHRRLDKDSLSHHNTASMDPRHIARILEKEGFEITYSGYFGGFLFWADYKTISKTQRLVSTFLYLLGFLLFWIPGNRSYSPFCGTIAKKAK